MSEPTHGAPDEVSTLEVALGYAAKDLPVVPSSRPLPNQPCRCDAATRDSTPKAHQAPACLHVGYSACGICNSPGMQTEICDYIVMLLLGGNGSALDHAAKSGYLPTVQVSEHRRVVPTARLLELLGLTLDRDSIVGGES